MNLVLLDMISSFVDDEELALLTKGTTRLLQILKSALTGLFPTLKSIDQYRSSLHGKINSLYLLANYNYL